MPDSIVKRDGRVVQFDQTKIELALHKCFYNSFSDTTPYQHDIELIVEWVVDSLENVTDASVTVERVQDLVEKGLALFGYFEQSKHYILYRAEHAKQRAERPIPEHVRQAFEADNKYFPTQIQRFQFMDKYARWNHNAGRRETWSETVQRTINELVRVSQGRLDTGIYYHLRDAILNMEIMPSMRWLNMAGPASERDSSVIYNCSYLPISDLLAFKEIMLLGMAGCGVGYSVEKQYVSQLPVIKVQASTNNRKALYVVEDSAEGWADALEFGLETWFNGHDVVFDFDYVRPEGTILKTKGGRASGPAPLKKLLHFIKQRVLEKQGKQLSTLDVHDIACAIGNAVISGGMRRTAMISLFDSDDLNMLNCKSGNFEHDNSQRWNANNSAVWVDDEQLTQTEFLTQFMEMVTSGRGEPGIFNRSAANRMVPERRKQNSGDVLYGSNPCFGAGTLVHTKQGHFPIEQLVGKTVDIWNGTAWQTVDNFRVTATNQPMLKITMHDGSEIRCTEYHTFITDSNKRVEARDLYPGQKLMISSAPESHGNIHTVGAYAKGFLLAEGTHVNDRPLLRIYPPKYDCITRIIRSLNEVPVDTLNTNVISNVEISDETYNRVGVTGLSARKLSLIDWVTTYRWDGLPNEIYAWDLESKCEFIAGLFDGDGTASDTSNGFMYQLTSINEQMIRDVQVLLKTINVQSTLRVNKPAGIKNFNDGYGSYQTRTLWRLTISQVSSKKLSTRVKFSRLTSFADKSLRYNGSPRYNTIAKIEDDSYDDFVYCCTVNGAHSFSISQGYHVGQCGEIILEPYQFCNLSVCVARPDDDFASLERKVQLATIIGTIQSMATHFPNLRPEWQQNAERERLLGVDITGQLDCPYLLDNPQAFKMLRDVAIKTNASYAKLLGINQSAAITTVKPSGNSAQLLNCSSGLHARWAPYYIRNVRVSGSSALARVLLDAGAPMVPENGDDPINPRTWVVSFPVKSPDGAPTRNDRSAITQCEWWLTNKLNWTEHNPSVTITYKPDEIIDLMKWVWDHKQYIGGMSFLPRDDAKYDNLPYIEISKAEYEQRLAQFPIIDWAKVYRYESEDYTTTSQELACVGGGCDNE